MQVIYLLEYDFITEMDSDGYILLPQVIWAYCPSAGLKQELQFVWGSLDKFSYIRL